MKRAILYLLGRIFALALFMVTLAFSPAIAMFLPAAYFLLMAIWSIFTKQKDTGGMFVTAIILLIASLVFMNDLLQTYAELFIYVSMCVTIIFAGVQAKRFVLVERLAYYYNDNWEKWTALYRILLIISGSVRLALEAAVFFLGESVPVINDVLYYPISGIGEVLFGAAIVLYIARTIHIFIENKT